MFAAENQKIMKSSRLVITIALAWAALQPVAKAQTKLVAQVETKAKHDARMEWWREAKFGMFIHWGVYSVPAGDWNGQTNYAEWIMEQGQIPASRYEQFAKEFDPVKFDAKMFVKTAKEAGMKYLVITYKHHDGFCLWPSALTDWRSLATPSPSRKCIRGSLKPISPSACRN